MEIIKISNSYYETLLGYEKDKQKLFIRIGSNNKNYEYSGVTPQMFKSIENFNNKNKAVGSIIIFLNDKGIFGVEVAASKVDWS